MNKLLTKIANDSRLSTGIVMTGCLLATISNVLIFTGVFYSALNRGFILGRESIDYEKEVGNG